MKYIFLLLFLINCTHKEVIPQKGEKTFIDKSFQLSEGIYEIKGESNSPFNHLKILVIEKEKYHVFNMFDSYVPFPISLKNAKNQFEPISIFPQTLNGSELLFTVHSLSPLGELKLNFISSTFGELTWSQKNKESLKEKFQVLNFKPLSDLKITRLDYKGTSDVTAEFVGTNCKPGVYRGDGQFLKAPLELTDVEYHISGVIFRNGPCTLNLSESYFYKLSLNETYTEGSIKETFYSDIIGDKKTALQTSKKLDLFRISFLDGDRVNFNYHLNESRLRVRLYIIKK